MPEIPPEERPDPPAWPVPQPDRREWDHFERDRAEAEIEAAKSRRDLIGHGPMPHLGDGVVRAVNFVQLYADLTSIAVARAEYVGRVLADEVAARGFRPTDAFIGQEYAINPRTGEPEEIGEKIRGLVELERWERQHAAKLLHDGVKIGVQIEQAEAVRAYADTVAVTAQQLLRELGIDDTDEVASRAAMRAVLAARRRQGFDDGDPDVIAGPPLNAAERERLLSRAIAS